MSAAARSDDRLLPADPVARSVARAIYAATARLPIVSPHGHVDARLIRDNVPFTDPAALFVTSDHYVTRLLHAHGVPLDTVGLGPNPSGTPREVWRTLCANWPAFRGTPSRFWLETALRDVFGIPERLSLGTADATFDRISESLTQPQTLPRSLFARFGIDVLATTDDPSSDLAAHRELRADPTFAGRVVPTFRPDAYLDTEDPQWASRILHLAAVSEIDTGDYNGFIDALRARRAFFRDEGGTATDYGPIDLSCEPLSATEAARVYRRCKSGDADARDRAALRGHLLFEMARMSSEDGLVMQLHPGVLRGHHGPTRLHYGPDTGHDIPVAVEFTRSLRPVLEAFGTSPTFRMVLFTVDETTFSRELAPLAGFYPSIYLGAPWWFLDTPDAMLRYRRAVTDTAGFYKTAGFVDDTRAFLSIPARHDMARRVDAHHLAELVVDGRLDLDEAVETAVDLAGRVPRDVFRLA